MAAVIDPPNPESVALAPPTTAEDAPDPTRRAALARSAAAAAGVYLGMHLITLLSVLWMLHVRKQSLRTIVHTPPHAWDATFYIEVARDGYQHAVDYAFFPLYPVLLRGLEAVTGLSFMTAGVIVSVLAGTAAAVGLRFVGERVAGSRAGLVLVALWAVAPTAVVQVWVYADGLFVALAAWSLYALLKRSWIAAGVLALLGGLTRPSAVALIATVGVVALVAAVRREDGWRPWVCGALAPLGLLGYVLYVGHHFGKLGAYFDVQHKVWNNWFDAGAMTWDELGQVVDGRLDLPNIPSLIALAVTVAVPFLIVLAVRARLPWPLILYSVLIVVLTLGSHRSQTTTARELMPAFPLLIPPALVLSRARIRGLTVGFAAVAVMSAWYAWYLPMVIGVP